MPSQSLLFDIVSAPPLPKLLSPQAAWHNLKVLTLLRKLELNELQLSEQRFLEQMYLERL